MRVSPQSWTVWEEAGPSPHADTNCVLAFCLFSVTCFFLVRRYVVLVCHCYQCYAAYNCT